MSLLLALILMLSQPSTCVPPGGDPARQITQGAVVLTWSNCLMSVRLQDGTNRTLFAGMSDKDTSPAVGQTATLTYDPVTNQLFLASFPSYPFLEPTSPPKTYTTLAGNARAGATVKLNVNYQPTQSVVADAQGNFQFANVEVGAWVAITPEMQNVLFDPSMWSVAMPAGGVSRINFTSYSFPWPASQSQIARIEIPANVAVGLNQTAAVNTKAFRADGSQIVPTPTLQYVLNNLSPPAVTMNWDAHWLRGNVVTTTSLQAVRPCTGDECVSTDLRIKSNIVAVAVTSGPTPPICRITAPVTNTIIPVATEGNCTGICAKVTYIATASDPDGGSIQKVSLWLPPQGGDPTWYQVGTDLTAPPYQWLYDLGPKTYTHVARCYDNSGAMGQSDPVTITVQASSPTPTPTPTPVPSPSPSPSPTPAPCSISAPASVTIPRKSSGTVTVTVNGAQPPVTVTATAGTGQVTVQPTTRLVSGTSALLQFMLTVKQNSSSVRFDSPCGSRTVQTVVN